MPVKPPDLDLGHGITARWRHPRYPSSERGGLVIAEQSCRGDNCRTPEGQPGPCEGSILFDLPGMAERFPNRELWLVEAFDPLTLVHAVKCGCHGCPTLGYIQAGRWIPA